MKLLDEMKQFFEETKAKPDFLDLDGDGDKKEPFKKAVKDKEVDEAAKPDYLDMDGDGNKKEPMKKAVKDKESVVNEVSTLGASKAMRIGRKLGWEAKKRSSGRTDYVTFTKDGKEYGPVDANVLTNDYLIKKLSETLKEANVTGNIDGGEGPPKTPHAFGKSEDEKDNAEVFDYKKASTSEKHFESAYKKMMATMEELHEVSYRDYKKDPTSTPQQKVNRGIMEVNRMVGEMEKIVNNNLRLKTEMGVQSGHFWKATGKRFAKINERMLRVAHRLKELSS